MKDILFRAKLENSNDWVYGFPTGTEWFIAFDEMNDFKEIKKVVIQPLTICQFTGYLDADKKPIFENDIVIEPTDRSKQTYRILFDEFYAAYRKSASLKSSGSSFLDGNYKIIGNTFDDINLFKESDYKLNSEIDSTPTSESSQKRMHKRIMNSLGK